MICFQTRARQENSHNVVDLANIQDALHTETGTEQFDKTREFKRVWDLQHIPISNATMEPQEWNVRFKTEYNYKPSVLLSITYISANYLLNYLLKLDERLNIECNVKNVTTTGFNFTCISPRDQTNELGLKFQWLSVGNNRKE